MSLSSTNLNCRKFYKTVCRFILCKMPPEQCVLDVKTLLPYVLVYTANGFESFLKARILTAPPHSCSEENKKA